MIDLNRLKSPADNKRPVFMTIVGEGGLGKTTLAAQFPAPVFIRTEDGTQSIADRDDVALFDVVKSTEELMEQIQALGTQEHEFKTVVLDSVTQLATMIEGEIVELDGKAKSINQAMGGYGAGLKAAAEEHRKIRAALEWLMTQKGMNVVAIAHADSETVEPPDSDSYHRYTIRIDKRAIQHWSDNVDLVGFIKMKTYLKGTGEKKKAVSKGERIITCYPVASHISKNRFGITEDIQFEQGTNPFSQFIKGV